MDESLKKKIQEKIDETFSNYQQISEIVNSLESLSTDQKSFAYGIVVGRLYNSFFYQCRRILKRDPTKEEFLEFLMILKHKESDFLKLNLK